MAKLIIIILIIFSYSFYHIQAHLSVQYIFAVEASLKNIFENSNLNSNSSLSNNKFLNTMQTRTNERLNIQPPVSPDRYIPPPPQFTNPVPNNQQQQQQQYKSQNALETDKNKIPYILPHLNITPDRYIPPPSFQNFKLPPPIQQIPIKNITPSNYILQNISSSLYNQINIDIDKGKSFFDSLYNFCTLPLIHFACNVDMQNLPPKYNFDNIKDLSNTAKYNLEEYKKNPTKIVEQNFKQANLNLTSCLNNLSINTQNQLHSLLGSQGEKTVQNLVNSLKIEDIVKAIVYDFVKVGSINEQLGIRPDPMANRCI